MAGLEKLEKEKRGIEDLIQNTERSSGIVSVPEEKLKQASDNARSLFLQGRLPQIRQLIALYVQNESSHHSQLNECGYGGGGEAQRTSTIGSARDS